MLALGSSIYAPYSILAQRYRQTDHANRTWSDLIELIITNNNTGTSRDLGFRQRDRNTRDWRPTTHRQDQPPSIYTSDSTASHPDPSDDEDYPPYWPAYEQPSPPRPNSPTPCDITTDQLTQWTTTQLEWHTFRLRIPDLSAIPLSYYVAPHPSTATCPTENSCGNTKAAAPTPSTSTNAYSATSRVNRPTPLPQYPAHDRRPQNSQRHHDT